MKRQQLILIGVVFLIFVCSSISSSVVLLNKRWRAQIKDALGIESLQEQANCFTTEDKTILLDVITEEKTCPVKKQSGPGTTRSPVTPPTTPTTPTTGSPTTGSPTTPTTIVGKCFENKTLVLKLEFTNATTGVAIDSSGTFSFLHNGINDIGVVTVSVLKSTLEILYLNYKTSPEKLELINANGAVLDIVSNCTPRSPDTGLSGILRGKCFVEGSLTSTIVKFSNDTDTLTIGNGSPQSYSIVNNLNNTFIVRIRNVNTYLYTPATQVSQSSLRIIDNNMLLVEIDVCPILRTSGTSGPLLNLEGKCFREMPRSGFGQNNKAFFVFRNNTSKLYNSVYGTNSDIPTSFLQGVKITYINSTQFFLNLWGQTATYTYTYDPVAKTIQTPSDLRVFQEGVCPEISPERIPGFYSGPVINFNLSGKCFRAGDQTLRFTTPTDVEFTRPLMTQRNLKYAPIKDTNWIGIDGFAAFEISADHQSIKEVSFGTVYQLCS